MAEKKIVANFEIQAQSAKQELDSLRAADEAFIQSGHALATDVTQGFAEIEKSVGKAFEKIESGGKVSQGQFDAIVSKLATMKEAIENAGVPLDQLPEQFTKALATGETQVASLAGAMDAARVRTESLKEEFARAGQEAGELAQKTQTAGERIEDSAKRADLAFAKFTQTLQDNPKEALEQLPRVAGAVIQLRQEIERTQKSGGVVDEKDLARLQQLETRLVETRESAKRLGVEINAATGGVGGRIDGITDAVQGLAGSFGPAGQAVGGFAGQVGQMAMGAQRAKDVLGGLDLNTLSVGASSTTLAVQMGALAAAVVAAVAAGKELAATNDENRQVMESLKDTLGSAIPSISGLKDELNGVQMAAQNALASIASGEWGDARRDIEAMGVAWKNGRDAGKLYYDLINRGVGELEASKIASENNRKAIEVYTQAMSQGGRSVELWNQAVRDSEGDSAKLAQSLEFLSRQLDDEKTRLDATTAAQKEKNNAVREAIDLARVKADDADRLLTAEERALQAVSSAQIYLAQATNGTTEAINQAVTTIAALVSESDKNSVALGNLSAALQTALGMTDGLTKAERDRIQAVIDMAKNANALTDAEQKRAAALAQQILTGQAASVALKEQAAATQDVAKATSDLSQATSDLSQAASEATITNDTYRTSLEQELSLVQAELEARGIRRDATREQARINLDLGVSTDYLLQKERALSEQLAGPSLASWSASSEAKTKQASATAELSAIIEREKAGQDALSTSTQQLTVTRENGRIALSNINDETTKVVGTIENGHKSITNLSDAERSATASGITFGEGMKNIRQPAADAAEVMRGLESAVTSLNTNLGSLESRLDSVNQRLREMKTALEEVEGGDADSQPAA